MNYREKSLIYQAQSLGYLGKEIPPISNIDIFLQKSFSQKQCYQLYFLYLKSCLLNGALAQNLINQQQKSILWNKAVTQQQNPTLFSIYQKIVPITFYQKLIARLAEQQILTKIEIQIFEKIASSLINTHQDSDYYSPNETLVANDMPEVKQNISVITQGNPRNSTDSLQQISTNKKEHSTTQKHSGSVNISDIFAGRYRIESELGRGGMGVVYKAYDNDLGRSIALKLILAKQAKSVQIQRFLKEAQVVAKLDHPNTIRIFDIGEAPQKYFTMEYIEGKTLSEYISKKSLTFRTTAKIINKVALALHNAHRQNLIHRDIKPSNIMLDINKEPRLMDFGLVKDAESDLSHEGDILGTPTYMSPEQAHGKVAVPGSDVYSLGATLYQALSGVPPFSGSSALNIIVQIMQKDPVPLRELNPDIPRELEAITLKCMEKKISRRYKSANSLAKDLENYLDNRPITASPPTQFTYLKKSIIRNKEKSILIAIIATLILTFTTIYFYQQIQARKKLENTNKELSKSNNERGIALRQKSEALKQKSKALKQKNQALNDLKKNVYKANIALTALRIEDANIGGAKNSLNKCSQIFRDNWEWKWLNKTLKIKHISFGKSPYRFCDFHPKNKTFIAARNSLLELWDIGNSQKPIWTSSPFKGDIVNCNFSPNGKLVLVSTNRNHKNRNRLFGLPVKNLYLVNASTGKIIHNYEGHAYEVKQSSFSADGKYIVSAGDDGIIKIWSTRKRQTTPVQEIDLLKKMKEAALQSGMGTDSFRSIKDFEISSCVFNKDGQYIIASRKDILMLWKKVGNRYQKVNELSYSMDIKRRVGNISNSTFNAQQNIIIVGTKYGYVDLWMIDNGKLRFIRSLEKAHNLGISWCCFSKSGKRMLTCGDDMTIVLWKVHNKGDIVFTNKYYGHSRKIMSCDFLKDGKSFISTADSVKLWSIDKNLRPAELLPRKTGTAERRGDFAKTKEQLLAIAGNDGLQIWNWHEKKLYKTFGKHRQFYSCAFHPLKNQVATCDKAPDLTRLMSSKKKKYEVVLWDIEKETSTIISTHNDAIRFCSFSNDGRYLASVGRSIKIFDFKNNREFELPNRHKKGMRWCGFSPKNSNHFITTSFEITLWDIDKKKEIHQFREGVYKATFAAFHPNKPFLLTADYYLSGEEQDISFALWDLENHKPLGRILGQKSNITSCTFNKEGNRIISSGRDRTIRIWDFNLTPNKKEKWNAQELLSLRKHEASVHHCCFSPNGRALVSMSNDGQVYLWDTE
ncbi:protein kinase [Candidatus Uabimicrobium sp. HlEnr_7]|uniref:protein kinase domain-containing protein n=1 Tax=Candidatus Uabimicrobium helgolandensis TaxID=3095367 RepID=UPI003557C2F7